MNIAAVRTLATEMRDAGATWTEIARVIRAKHGVPSLMAVRLARGWTRTDVAKVWNERWPEDDKSLKNVAYWEAWPREHGYPVAIPNLIRLAELYEVAVSDLLEGLGDFRHLDAHHLANGEVQGS